MFLCSCCSNYIKILLSPVCILICFLAFVFGQNWKWRSECSAAQISKSWNFSDANQQLENMPLLGYQPDFHINLKLIVDQFLWSYTLSVHNVYFSLVYVAVSSTRPELDKYSFSLSLVSVETPSFLSCILNEFRNSIYKWILRG